MRDAVFQELGGIDAEAEPFVKADRMTLGLDAQRFGTVLFTRDPDSLTHRHRPVSFAAEPRHHTAQTRLRERDARPQHTQSGNQLPRVVEHHDLPRTGILAVDVLIGALLFDHEHLGAETEDLIQEGMIGLYRAVGEYRPDREGSMSFKNFASLCVSRRIIDAVKASARKKNVPLNNYVSLFQSEWEMPVSSPEEEVIRGEDRREFLQKMGRELSDFEFRVTVMYMDGLSCAEICEATGKEEKSVDNAIQRSKKKLQKLLKR